MLSCAVVENQQGREEERKTSIAKASAVMLLLLRILSSAPTFVNHWHCLAFRRARELVMLTTRTREATDDYYGPVRFVSSNSPPDRLHLYLLSGQIHWIRSRTSALQLRPTPSARHLCLHLRQHSRQSLIIQLRKRDLANTVSNGSTNNQSMESHNLQHPQPHPHHQRPSHPPLTRQQPSSPDPQRPQTSSTRPVYEPRQAALLLETNCDRCSHHHCSEEPQANAHGSRPISLRGSSATHARRSGSRPKRAARCPRSLARRRRGAGIAGL
jgi:hypothetical protein